MCNLVEVGLYHFPPMVHHIVVVADQYIEGIKFNHFLEANDQDVSFVNWKVEEFLLVLLGKLLRINCIAVPGEHIQHCLLIGAVFDFIQHILANIVVKEFSLGELFLIA